MTEIRKEWWITKLRSKVKKMVNTLNVCKVFNTKHYGATATADMPHFLVEASRPFENRSRFCRTYRFQDRKEGAGKVLHFAVYLRHVEGVTFRIDEDPDGRRISEKVKLVYNQENKVQSHDIR